MPDHDEQLTSPPNVEQSNHSERVVTPEASLSAPVIGAATVPERVTPSPVRTIFVGPNGIRAGWRLLIWFCIVSALSLVVRILARALFGPPPKTPSFEPVKMMTGEAIAIAIAVIAAVIMTFVEREKWAHYGLPLRRALRTDFWFGCLWGFGALSCVIGVLHLAGAYQIDGLALSGAQIAKFALLWGVVFLLVGIFEEFLVRGYLFYTLASGIRFWPAAVLTSAVFFAGHIRNQGETWFGLADVFVIGMFFCFTLWRTGDLWFAVGLHASWDWGQSFFYSVADSGMIAPGHLFRMHTQGPAWLSGGTVGPEGSIVSLASHLLLFLLFALVYKRRKWVGMTERRRAAAPNVPQPLVAEPQS